MKVIGIYGSQTKQGCTYTAMNIVGEELAKEGIGLDLIHIGTEAYKTCCDCRSCRKNHLCAYDDIVNDIIRKLPEYDGLLLGSATHYMGITPSLKAVLDRLCYATEHFEDWNRKPVACVTACRRTGSREAYKQLENYIIPANQILIGSQYLPIVFGWKPEETLAQDIEGVETLHVLGKNFAWALKVINNAAKDIIAPLTTKRTRTNYCREL